MAHFSFLLLLLSTLSALLSLTILSVASHVLHSFNAQKQTNPWWLPIWPSHFDTRPLAALIGCTTGTLLLNGVVIVGVLVRRRASSAVLLATSTLSAILSLIALVVPSALNAHSPARDTMQTWTCRWADTDSTQVSNGAPPDFSRLCVENRFAYYATIPLFVLQLVIPSLALWSLLRSRRAKKIDDGTGEEEKSAAHGGGYDHGDDEVDGGDDGQHDRRNEEPLTAATVSGPVDEPVIGMRGVEGEDEKVQPRVVSREVE